MTHHTKESLVGAEAEIIKLFEAGELPYLLHLSGGNEDELIHIFKDIQPEDYVLGTHRAHYHYLLKGGTVESLIVQIKAGKSMFLFSRELNFLTSSIVAGLVTAAAGLALSIQLKGQKNHVWCFVGDGAEDEGHFYEAVRFAHSRKLPITFIIEDNDRSVDTSKVNRWGAETCPIEWPSNVVQKYSYTPTYPHAGTGGNLVKFTEQAIERARRSWKYTHS